MSDFYYQTWRERRTPRNWFERLLSCVGVRFYVTRGEFASMGSSCKQPARFMGVYDTGVEDP